ncbi:PEP-CTERM sorting domain-containing protein [bacterium]|nr:PEP-CTERM sorting domain-containing protein [bacterium]
MKNTLYSLLASISAIGAASAAVTFHSDFDEANLGAITGLNIDTPSTSGADSGTVTLDTVSQRLDLTANAANTWTAREGAPIAWVSSPVVAVGETWYVQTQITHTNGTGVNSTWDQSGITFYSGTAGANPGSENPATAPLVESQSLFFGVNNWNAWQHKVQGLADNNPNVAVGASLVDDTFEYRIEITEGGASDTYNFFYREASVDPWTQVGGVQSGHFNNSAVGMFMKSNDNNATASTEFDYFTVGTVDAIPEPGTGMLAGFAGLALVMRRRRK